MPRTYANNASNRSLGRVGMPHGSMVVSSGSSSRSSSGSAGGTATSSTTYVDNTYNRRLGRVGMEHGSMTISKGSTSESSNGNVSKTTIATPHTYADNAFNRKAERVGLPKGSMVISKGDLPHRSNQVNADAPFVYTDNAYNRRHGRVGQVKGTAVISSKIGEKQEKMTKTYADNKRNRSSGRVGQPCGSMPLSRHSKSGNTSFDKQLETDLTWMMEELTVAEEGYDNRMLEENLRVKETGDKESTKTSRSILTEYSGRKIDFEEIDLRKKIGGGGFGDVHFAIWNGSVVAVKKLRVERVSKKRLDEFTDEVLNFCNLEHPNIVRFIGACVVTPNLAVVMEYMQMSLFDALHVRDDEIDFSEDERLMIVRQICSGLEYLHKIMAHCDLKSQNILLNYTNGETCLAKITDFGLSMIKYNTDTSTSGTGEVVRNAGTPRYSAPEVLRGEYLSQKDMMKSDIYSFSLVLFELIYEEEPFYNLSYTQLKKQVGDNGIKPDIPTTVHPDDSVRQLMESCWHFIPGNRPSIQEVQETMSKQHNFYSE